MGVSVKRELSVNLKRLQPPYVSNVLCQSAKAGHWETEKAYAAAQARADFAAPYSQARRPTNVLFSVQNARAEYYF